jgi:hypothetical protein
VLDALQVGKRPVSSPGVQLCARNKAPVNGQSFSFPPAQKLVLASHGRANPPQVRRRQLVQPASGNGGVRQVKSLDARFHRNQPLNARNLACLKLLGEFPHFLTDATAHAVKLCQHLRACDKATVGRDIALRFFAPAKRLLGCGLIRHRVVSESG